MQKADTTKMKSSREDLEPSWETKQDHALIRQVLGGDVNQYRHLVEKYQVPVYNLFLRMLKDAGQANELTQQTFVKAYMALEKFRFEYRFYSWIYRIAINLALSTIKRQKRNVGLEQVAEMAAQTAEQGNPDEIILKAAIKKLRDKHRIVIELKYFSEMSYNDIAETLELPEKRVKSRLYDARLQLKALLEEAGYFNRE